MKAALLATCPCPNLAQSLSACHVHQSQEDAVSAGGAHRAILVMAQTKMELLKCPSVTRASCVFSLSELHSERVQLSPLLHCLQSPPEACR